MGLIGLLAAGAVSGCQNVPEKIYEDKGMGETVTRMIEAEENTVAYAGRPSFDEFRGALGDRYIPERDSKLRSYLEGEDVDRLDLVYRSYVDPNAVVAGFDEGTRKEYQDFDLDSYTDVDRKVLTKDVPWRVVFDEPSNFDRLYLFELSKFLK